MVMLFLFDAFLLCPLFLGCSPESPESEPSAVDVPSQSTGPTPPENQVGKTGKHQGRQHNGPQHGGHAGPMGGDPSGSGAALQDPSGFPAFHDQPAPRGPAIEAMGSWSSPIQLTEQPAGGYRPQIAVSSDGIIHAIYYNRVDEGDIIRHQRSTDQGRNWTEPQPLGHSTDRNWGPDIVVRDNGSVVVSYDHALPDFSSQGFLTIFDDNEWSAPSPLTESNGDEIGSGHIAHGTGETLAYIYIGKKMGPENRFQARARWFVDGSWSEVQALSDGTEDAWHTNVERRPDGSILAGFDIGQGGAATTLYVAEGRDGSFGELENMTATSHPGERPHFAFGVDGVDHITWFHKENGQPKHIYVRSGNPGNWGETVEPSKGFGGYHFDPDIAINDAGVRCLVWGWDAGEDAEMVYSIDRGDGWTPPSKIADINWGKPGLASLDVGPDGHFYVIWNQGIRGENQIYTASLQVDP